jgi:hypothetical protein
MSSLLMTFREAGTFGYLQVALLFAGGLWALVCAVLLGLRWRVPPVLAIGPLVAVPLLIGVASLVNEAAIASAITSADPAYRATLVAAGVAETLSQGLLGVLVLPVAGLLGIGGLAAGVRGPRTWVVPGVVFAVAGLTALLPALGLLVHASAPLAIGRVLLYGTFVIPLALATVTAHPGRNGPEGGMVAAAAWMSLVAACELATLSAAWYRGFGALAMVDAGSRAVIVESLVSEVGTQGTFAWFTFALAAVPALLVGFRSAPDPTEAEIMTGLTSPSPYRSVGRFLALVVWPAWAFAYLCLDPSDTLRVLMTTGG